ncbi:hypothetical protein HPB50_006252 [Hyalomma asiaticum]|uniref:Uncharacterized protein n=1 Tax=Hyalomma asiaticum TaxID=266040 RepID=A0ACB7SNZ6_HYAAI|nr:hypothetical protein HPB50_006252 [Hyalomma asiaticum]
MGDGELRKRTYTSAASAKMVREQRHQRSLGNSQSSSCSGHALRAGGPRGNETDGIFICFYFVHAPARHNVGRRRARGEALLKDARESARFVHAAQNATPAKVEQVAIALALLDDSKQQIFTDSRAAVRAFAPGSVSAEIYHILGHRDISPHIWFPAHLGSRLASMTKLNEIAHAQARELTALGSLGNLRTPIFSGH